MVPLAKSKTAHSRTIAQELRGLILWVALPMTLIVVAQGFVLYRTAIHQAQEFLRNDSHNVQFDATRFLGETARGLNLIAARPSVIRMDPAHCDPGLGDLIGIRPRYLNTNVTDRDGWVICGATPPPDGPRSINVSERDWFQAVLAGQPFSFGAARKGPILDRWVITAAAPIRAASGNIVGVISVAIDLEKWFESDHQSTVALDTIHGIIDQTGLVIMRSPEPEKWVGTTNPDLQLIDRIIAVGEGTFTAKGRQGFERIWAVKPIPNTNWMAFVAARADQVLAAPTRYAALAAIAYAIILLTIIVLLIRASCQISSSIAALAAVSLKVTTGYHSTRAALDGPDEITAVARQFNHMLDAIEQHAQALRESENRWQFALEGSGDGLWDWNVTQGTVFFSKRWKAMLGYSEDEIGNALEEWESRIHADDKADTLATVQRYLEGKTPIYSSDHRVRCKDGGYKWILDRGMVISRSEDGKPRRMIGTHSDVTATRLAAEALKQQGAQLLQRNEELDRFNRVMVGRELGVIDLKRQVNALSRELGRAEAFNLAFADAPPDPPSPNEAKDSTPPDPGALR